MLLILIYSESMHIMLGVNWFYNSVYKASDLHSLLPCLGRFWWSLLVGVDWWDAVGCTQSAAEDGIGKKLRMLNLFLGVEKLFYPRLG